MVERRSSAGRAPGSGAIGGAQAMIALSRSRHPGRAIAPGLIVVATFVCGAASARAERLLVLPASGEHVSAAIVAWAREHVVSRLAVHGHGRFELVDQNGPPTAEPPGSPQAIAAALAAGATRAVTFHLAHHRDQTWLTLTCHPTAAGSSPLRVTERTVAGPLSLPALVDRMVLALLFPDVPPPSSSGWAPPGGNQPAMYPQGDPALRASARPLRSRREIFFGVGAGAHLAFNTAGHNDLWLPSAKLFVMKLNVAWMADAHVDYASAGESNLMSLGAGFYRPFSAPAAPSGVYLGGGAKWTWLQLGGRSADGLAIHPTIGFYYRMGWSPILRVEMAYVVNLFRELELDRLIPNSGDGFYSHGPLATVGMAF